MSRAFYFSLAGNFVLIAISLALWVRGNVPNSSILAVSPESPAFHWRQIDSDDFPTFVSNLRSIGCPESIIHDIVKGELTEIYAEKEKAAVAPALPDEVRSNPASAIRAAGSQPRQTVLEVRAERDQTLAALLAPAGPAKPVVSTGVNEGQHVAFDFPNSVSPQSIGQPQAVQQIHTPAPVYPVFASHVSGSTNSGFASPRGGAEPIGAGTSATAAPVSAEEQAVLEKIQNNFVQAVGGVDQDPTAPAYLERWEEAQRMSDNQYKRFFGGRAFVQRQMEDARRAAAGK
jgi:hypothetical protein